MASAQLPQAPPAAAPRRRAILVESSLAAVQAIVIVGLAFFGLGGFDTDFRVPLDFANDTLVFLAQSKATLDNGWWWVNPRLSAPSAFPALLFPSNTNVDQALVWLVGLIVRNPALNINLTWIGMLALGGVSATFALRSLGLSRAASLACGTLFALAPYAIYRQLGHFSLVIYMVPFPAALVIHLATGLHHLCDRPWTRRALLTGCAIMGFNYVYYPFFACFFILIATGAGWFLCRQRSVLRLGGVSAALILVCVTLNFAPTIYAVVAEGSPFIVRHKEPAEAEVYGLKVRQLISPVFDHPFAPFDAWNRKEAAAGFPLETENRSTRLGLVASIGFLALLGSVLLAGSAARRPGALLFGTGQLAIAAVLLATIGGFGSLFNLLAVPEIRGYNRIAPFIAFFGLVAVAAGIDAIGRRRRQAGVAVALAVLAVGLWDQWQPMRGIAMGNAMFRAEYLPLRSFVAELEAALPQGAMVLQLPFTIYLNDTGRVNMRPYDHFKPYLVSRHLRWSYPALSDPQFEWQEGAAQLSSAELPGYAAAEEFSAILIDRHGYSDNGAAVQAALLAVPGTKVLQDGSRYTAIDVRAVARPAWLTSAKRLEMQRDTPMTAGLPQCAGSALASLDRIAETPHPGMGASVPVSGSHMIELSGWAVSAADKRAVADVEIDVDGTLGGAFYGFDRPDVAAYLGNPAAEPSGFRARIPATLLPPGTHAVKLRVVAAGAACYYEVPAATLQVH